LVWRLGEGYLSSHISTPIVKRFLDVDRRVLVKYRVSCVPLSGKHARRRGFGQKSGKDKANTERAETKNTEGTENR